MKHDAQIGALIADRGSVRRIESHVTSATTAAVYENLGIYETTYLGTHFRPERIAISMSRATFGLAAMENRIPELSLLWHAATTGLFPTQTLSAMDSLLEQAGGSYRAPAIKVIPVVAMSVVAYRFSESYTEAMNAWYGEPNWIAINHKGKGNKGVDSTLTGQGGVPAVACYKPNTKYSYAAFEPTRPNEAADPFHRGGSAEPRSYFVPIQGGGVTPVLGTWDETSGQLKVVVPLRWAIIFQIPDVEIVSPARKLMMIAYLNNLMSYFDGTDCDFSRAGWEPYDPATPTSHSPHSIANRYLAQVLRVAAERLQYLSADELENSDELAIIRAIYDVTYLLNNWPALRSALINTTEVTWFMRTLLYSSLLSLNGTYVRSMEGTPHQQDLDLGLVPPQAREFLLNTVCKQMAWSDLTSVTLAALGSAPANVEYPNPNLKYGALVAQGVEGYAQLLTDNGDLSGGLRQVLAKLVGVSGVDKDSVAAFAQAPFISMRADFLAAALLARVRDGLPILGRLLRGEIAGFEHIHVPVEQMIDWDVTADILAALEMVFSRDLIGTTNLASWSTPYGAASWQTQFGSYYARFPRYPIRYVVHDAGREVVSMPKTSLGLDVDIANVVEQAFQTLGVSLVECEPELLSIAYNQKLSRLATGYFAMETDMIGLGAVADKDAKFYANMAVDHGALCVTSVFPILSERVWQELILFMQANSARNYVPQPMSRRLAPLAYIEISVPELREAFPWIDALYHLMSAQDLPKIGMTMPVRISINPAFDDVAAVMPYVQMYTVTPPEAHEFTLLSRLEYMDQPLCDLSGTVVVADKPLNLDGLVGAGSTAAPWRVPSLATGLAYTPRPMGHQVLPVMWDALR